MTGTQLKNLCCTPSGFPTTLSHGFPQEPAVLSCQGKQVCSDEVARTSTVMPPQLLPDRGAGRRLALEKGSGPSPQVPATQKALGPSPWASSFLTCLTTRLH